MASRRTFKYPLTSTGRIDLPAVIEMATDAPAFKNAAGIEGRLVQEGKYPYTRLMFKITTKGRKSPAYRQTKRELGDDWDSDLSHVEPEVWQDYIERALRRKLP